ncbi:MAG: Gfo/Idh/MocA family oxidoreductase [Rhodothermales bacterium]|nr:Gfo/Idh/MocA family oxidoreductase [Rhodothermales bacterium]
MDRRTFITSATVAGVGASLGGAAGSSRAAEGPAAAPGILRRPPHSTVRIGVIGTGLRGRNHLRLILQRDDTEVPAICDIDPAAIEASKGLMAEAGAPGAAVYDGDEHAYLEMLEREDLDGVIIATPWLWHTRMSVAAMRAGVTAGVEVSAANTLEECWDLVNTSEETGVPCMILENVCYRRDVMAVLNMVREGLFGELLYMECGYQHDLREVKFNDGTRPYGGGVKFGPEAFSEAKWRTAHSVHRNGDLYPTHGIGPVGNWLDINRGNRFISMTSSATKSRGLHKYIVDQAGEDHPNADVRFKLGDIVTSTIQTQNGETIIVKHDTNNPRPYSLGFRVQGTEGLWMDLNESLHIQGVSPRHQWEDAAPYLEEYDHPLWKRYEDRAAGAGHDDMDFFVDHAFVESIKRAQPAPMDAYDAAAWSAITPLSEISIAAGGALVHFPDFTRGRWMTRKPDFALGDEY